MLPAISWIGNVDRLEAALPWNVRRLLQSLKAGRWQHSSSGALIIALLLAWTCSASKFWMLCRDWKRRRFLYISSPLQGTSFKLGRMFKDGSWSYAGVPDRWWGSCPCCKRPFQAQLVAEQTPKESLPEARGKYAFVITIWGSSAEYVLGAMVLGYSIKKTRSPHTLVCLHTDDVPQSFVRMLSKMWDCRLVEHVKAVPELSSVGEAHRFAKVFTKLRALSLVEFEKVLMLDIDLLVMGNIDDLFDLRPPAALRRGMNDAWQAYKHGDPIDGRPFFQGSESWSSSWGQGTGINAGVMLLQPDNVVLEAMLAEIRDSNHPSHVAGSNGPEQDYLSRYWADAPWTYISVEYNFQLHQMFFALQPDRANTTERAALLRTPGTIKVVHFSGSHETAKPWHRVLDKRFSALWPDRGGDAEYTRRFAGEFAGYWLWVLKDATTWAKITKTEKTQKGRLDQDTNGMFVGCDGNIYRRQSGEGSASRVEIPQAVIDGSMFFLAKSLGLWFDTLEELQKELGFHQWCELAAAAVPSAGQNLRSTCSDRWAEQQRRREPGGWWTEQVHTADCASEDNPQAIVVCSASDGSRFVKFIEAGVEVYHEESEDLSGIFAKVVGPNSARHFRIGCSRNFDEALESIRFWVGGVPSGETVLLAIVGLAQDELLAAVDALKPLGVPSQAPEFPASCALAAVGVRRLASWVDEGSWGACHASSDVAYAAMSLK